MAALLLLLAAFEWPVPAGVDGAMLAGLAYGDWRQAMRASPAAVRHSGRASAAVAYGRPYGLEGLHAGVFGAAARWRGWACGVAVSSLGLGRYRELDQAVCAAALLPGSLAAGLGLHGLFVQAGPGGPDFAPSVDAGLEWTSGRLNLAAGVRRLNRPRFGNGDEPGAEAYAGAAWRPAGGLTLAADVERLQGVELVRLGAEFAPVPALRLRCGLGTEPLSYAAGVGLAAGPLGLDYAFRFHPALAATHLLALQWSSH